MKRSPMALNCCRERVRWSVRSGLNTRESSPSSAISHTHNARCYSGEMDHSEIQRSTRRRCSSVRLISQPYQRQLHGGTHTLCIPLYPQFSPARLSLRCHSLPHQRQHPRSVYPREWQHTRPCNCRRAARVLSDIRESCFENILF